MTARQLITDILRYQEDLDAEVEVGFLYRGEFDEGLHRELSPMSYIRSIMITNDRIQILGESRNVRTEYIT